MGAPVAFLISPAARIWSRWAWVWMMATTWRPRAPSSLRISSASPPGSTSKALPVRVSPMMEQLHCNGPTGKVLTTMRSAAGWSMVPSVNTEQARDSTPSAGQAKQAATILGGDRGHLLDVQALDPRHLGRDFDDVPGLILLAPVGDRRQPGGVGFHQQALHRHLPDHFAQRIGIAKGNDPGE